MQRRRQRQQQGKNSFAALAKNVHAPLLGLSGKNGDERGGKAGGKIKIEYGGTLNTQRQLWHTN